MNLKKLILSTTLTATLFCAPVWADTTLTYKNAEGTENSKMYLSDGFAKVTNESDVDTALIFNAGQNSFAIINHEDKSYMVFGEKEIAALGDVSSMVDRMLEEQLAQMPAAQREQMREMMKSMVQKQLPKQAVMPKYEKTGKSSSYNSFSCELVVQTVDGMEKSEFCVADYQDLGVATVDYAAIQAFMKIAEKMSSQFGHYAGANFAAVGAVLPVYYEMGQEKAYLTGVNNDKISAAVFSIPDGYQQQTLPKEIFK
jgi:hypothetical protein